VRYAVVGAFLKGERCLAVEGPDTAAVESGDLSLILMEDGKLWAKGV